MPDQMLMVPAISVLDGRFVIDGKDGRYEALEDEEGEPVDPLAFLGELVSRRGEIVFLKDINGKEGKDPQYAFLKKSVGLAELWVDAGSPSGDQLIDVIFAGAQKAVLSTKSMGGLEDIETALEVSDGILLCIDYDKGLIARDRTIAKMTPRRLAEEVEELGLTEVIVADHGRRKKDTFNKELITDLMRSDLGVFIAGNVVEKDRPGLEKLGVRGALLDMTEVLNSW